MRAVPRQTVAQSDPAMVPAAIRYREATREASALRSLSALGLLTLPVRISIGVTGRLVVDAVHLGVGRYMAEAHGKAAVKAAGIGPEDDVAGCGVPFAPGRPVYAKDARIHRGVANAVDPSTGHLAGGPTGE